MIPNKTVETVVNFPYTKSPFSISLLLLFPESPKSCIHNLRRYFVYLNMLLPKTDEKRGMKMTFLHTFKPFIQEAWNKSGFERPTAIQEKAIPLIIEGKDMIASAPTGTGKTLAYLLPILEKIDPTVAHIQAMILASSHELVMQIHSEIQKWANGSEIKSLPLIGGANIKRQIENLKKKQQIIVGTPGRIQELLKMKKLKLHQVKTIVFDEGDQLLVDEHMQAIDDIVRATKSKRQIVLFSATLPDYTKQLANDLMQNPETIVISYDQNFSSKVEHLYFVCEERDKIELLRKIARMDNVKALAFANDKARLSVLTEKLAFRKLLVKELHSETKKQDRAQAIKDFRAGKFPLLLATDVAARGLDIERLTHVIQLDLPKNTDQYVHRAGRTGRAGASGTVISIVTPREEKILKTIAKKLKLNIVKKQLYKGQIIDAKNDMKNNKIRSKKSHDRTF